MEVESKLRRTIGVLAALSVMALASAQGKITSVTARQAGSGVEITISGENLSHPSISRAYGNHSVILDFSAKLATRAAHVNMETGGVKYYNFAQHSARPIDARLQVRLTDTSSPTITKTKDGWVVGIHTDPISNDQFVMPPLEPATKIVGANTHVAATSTLATATTQSFKTPSTTDPVKTLKSTGAASPATKGGPFVTPPLEPASMTRVNPSTISTDPAKAPGIIVSAAASKADQPIVIDGTPSNVPEPKHAKKSKKKGMVVHKSLVKADPQPMVASSGTFDRRVSLDFANTDVVQVLKALALQAGVNIVTSPDVTGKVTVSLDNVSVKDALDLVTTMAGVRYAKVGSTFIVTSPSRFSDAIKQIGGQADVNSETRVVPIFSGMGGQIQVAVERAIPTDGTNKYVIILPSQDVTEVSSSSDSAGPAAPAAAPGAAPAAAAPAGGGTTTTASAKAIQKSGKDTYVVIVGQKSKLDEVETAVKELDSQLCKALMIAIPDQVVATSAVYKTNVNSAKSLLAAIAEPDKMADLKNQPNRTTVGKVQLYASNSGPQGDQLIIMHGPKNEVDQLVSVLGQLDDPGLTNSSVVLYEVKFGDPRGLLDELLAQIPGLRVMIPSSSAANPGVFQENKAEEMAAKQGAGAQPASSATPSTNTGSSSSSASSIGASSGSGGSSGGSSSGSSLGEGLSLPFSALESGAVPMRLVLKGTKAQIDQALDYLKIVDIAPKQVALEMRVMELSKTDAINAGLNWDLLTGGAVKFIKLDNGQDPASMNNTAGAHIGGHGWGLDVGAQLDKIATSSNLISRPNLLAMDGRESELFIGDVIRYVASSSTTQNGSSVVTGEVRVGVRLSVLPRVGADGAITMELRPIVSFLTGFDRHGGANLPQTSERIAQSTLSVKSGETMAIGGLIQDQDKKNAQGLPILMDLPVVGNLFKRTTNSKARTELVIFLTAREVDGPATSATKLPQQMPEPKAGK